MEKIKKSRPTYPKKNQNVTLNRTLFFLGLTVATLDKIFLVLQAPHWNEIKALQP